MSISLAEDLQTPKTKLGEFKELTERILAHIENVITKKIQYKDYLLFTSEYAGITKRIRPINKNLFIFKIEEFNKQYSRFLKILEQLSERNFEFNKSDYLIIDKVVYTIQQSIGIGLDLLVESNSAKKHVGNRFEELIRLIVTEMGVSNKKIILKIPYSKKDSYRCETDLIISPFDEVRSNPNDIDVSEIVISLKTTSKDRMGKIFIDKLLMSKFVKHKVKIVGIFLNDVQRKQEDKVSSTLVSNLFLVYTKFLTKLEGVYYIDIPYRVKDSSLKKYIFPFSKFIFKDIWKLLNPEV